MGFAFLDGLNESQLLAVQHSGSPLLILAGAGSGKTKVITSKIAYLIAVENVPAESILAVTFTNKAANEMRERVYALEPRAYRSQIKTFHSFGAWFLRIYGEEMGLSPDFTIYDTDDCTSFLMTLDSSLNRAEARTIVNKFLRVKDYGLTEDSEGLKDFLSSPHLVKLFGLYNRGLKKIGKVDFGDLINLPAEYISGLREQQKWRNKFRVILIDEYQDTNRAQFKLLQALADENTYVCVVGDDDQSIYKFRGAEVENILTFPDVFSGTKIIKLEKNYRSSPEILSIANQIIDHNSGRLGKKLVADKSPGEKPLLVFLPTQNLEAEYIGELIKKYSSGGGFFRDWAVLYRLNAQSLNFEKTFRREKIPYRLIGALKFYEREEVKDALALLSLLVNHKDVVAFKRMINKPARGVGAGTIAKILSKADEIEGDLISACNILTGADSAGSISPKAVKGIKKFVSVLDSGLKSLNPVGKVFSEDKGGLFEPENPMEKTPEPGDKNLGNLIDFLVKESGILEFHKTMDRENGSQKIANIEELINTAAPYDFSLKGLLGFLEDVTLEAKKIETGDNQDEDDYVTLITIHNTKGLEFPNVVLTGLETGVFPRETDLENQDELEEERRLMYVGVTRAKDRLFMTSCRTRLIYGMSRGVEPSVFLKEFNPAGVEIKGDIPPSFENYLRKYNQGEDGEDSPELKEWKKGQKVYHDDFGYGYVKESSLKSGEVVINVVFETGASKVFIPKYQGSVLVKIDE